MLQFALAWRRVLTVAGVGFVTTVAAQAQPLPAEFDGVLWGSHLALGLDPGGPMMPPGRGGGKLWSPPVFGSQEGAIPMPPILRGLTLSEAQQDEVFAILHAQAPLLREKVKLVVRAEDELKALASSARYDTAIARTLANEQARAQGELALLRADGEHRIYLTLTDDQREQLGALQQMGRRR